MLVGFDPHLPAGGGGGSDREGVPAAWTEFQDSPRERSTGLGFTRRPRVWTGQRRTAEPFRFITSTGRLSVQGVQSMFGVPLGLGAAWTLDACVAAPRRALWRQLDTYRETE